MRFALTFDAHDPALLARFWSVALGYVDAGPPEGWTTWESWLRDMGVPEDEWNDGAVLEDPAGVGPRVTFLKVPEPKTAKNRLHIDVWASGGRHLPHELRRERIEAVVATLTALGAAVASEGRDGDVLDHVVMADPEGNEFCVA